MIRVMLNSKLLPLFCVLNISTAFIARAQIAERIDSLAKVHQSHGFNGNVLYSKNDSIVFKGSYGFKDFESKKPLHETILFGLASCTKQFTAMAIIQLVEKKLIGHDTKVDEIIPGFPYKNITIEHLLRHQAGLPDYQKIFYNKKYWDRRQMATHHDVVDLLNKLKLELSFELGSKYDYDNTGHVVLAVIIEKNSGQSYQDYIGEHIFIPAGMHSSKITSVDLNPEHLNNVAMGYTYDERKKRYQGHMKIKTTSTLIG